MTTTEKNATISQMILDNVAAGLSVRAAFDAVLGAGRYDAMASDVYDALLLEMDPDAIILEADAATLAVA